MPPPPDPHGIAIMVLAVVALILFSRDRIPMETSALAVLGVLVTGFELFPYLVPEGRLVRPADFLAGFGNAALVTVMSLLVCTRALEVTGALHPVADRIVRLWLRNPTLALLAVLLLACGLSMFLNNTPVVAMLLPILVSVSLRTGQPASSILMPVGYATIIGGMCTTIGTSTNLLVVDVSTISAWPRWGSSISHRLLLPGRPSASFSCGWWRRASCRRGRRRCLTPRPACSTRCCGSSQAAPLRG
jgi:di/tricarboxylate transporter